MTDKQPKNIPMGIQIPDEMREALRKDAESNFRTVGMHLLWILKQYLNEIEIDDKKRGY